MQIPRFDPVPSAHLVPAIIAAVARHHHLSPNALTAASRAASVIWPRHLAMWLARKITNAPFHAIAAHFYRGHATVIHACRNAQDAMDVYPQAQNEAQYWLLHFHAQRHPGNPAIQPSINP